MIRRTNQLIGLLVEQVFILVVELGTTLKLLEVIISNCLKVRYMVNKEMENWCPSLYTPLSMLHQGQHKLCGRVDKNATFETWYGLGLLLLTWANFNTSMAK